MGCETYTLRAYNPAGVEVDCWTVFVSDPAHAKYAAQHRRKHEGHAKVTVTRPGKSKPFFTVRARAKAAAGATMRKSNPLAGPLTITHEGSALVIRHSNPKGTRKTNPRPKYATAQEEKWIEELLAVAKAGNDKLVASGQGSYLSEIKNAITWLVVNDATFTARSLAEGIARLDPSIYVDARVTGKPAVGQHSSRVVTKSDVTKTINALRKAFAVRAGRKANPSGGRRYRRDAQGHEQPVWASKSRTATLGREEAQSAARAGREPIHYGNLTYDRASAEEYHRLTGRYPRWHRVGNPKPLSKKALDKLIEQIYYKHASGLQINVMDIGKVFRAGEKAYAAGGDVEEAVKGAIGLYCKKGNPKPKNIRKKATKKHTASTVKRAVVRTKKRSK